LSAAPEIPSDPLVSSGWNSPCSGALRWKGRSGEADRAASPSGETFGEGSATARAVRQLRHPHRKSDRFACPLTARIGSSAGRSSRHPPDFSQSLEGEAPFGFEELFQSRTDARGREGGRYRRRCLGG
jgi:hypothetical protein